jgi:hypothetical protein
MTYYNEILKIPSLNETNFQEFLSNNQRQIFVSETEDYDYHYYLPSYCKITQNCKTSGRFTRQWG